jgi:hypothetical protein
MPLNTPTLCVAEPIAPLPELVYLWPATRASERASPENVHIQHLAEAHHLHVRERGGHYITSHHTRPIKNAWHPDPCGFSGAKLLMAEEVTNCKSDHVHCLESGVISNHGPICRYRTERTCCIHTKLRFEIYMVLLMVLRTLDHKTTRTCSAPDTLMPSPDIRPWHNVN